MLVYGLLFVPAVGWLVGDTLGPWWGIGSDRGRALGLVGGLLVGAAVAAWPFVLVRSYRGELREDRRQALAAAPVEQWSVDVARAWAIEASPDRALLLELPGGRLAVVASRRLETLPPRTFPAHVELEALPQLDRLLSLTASGEPRPVEPAVLTFEELGNDHPLKKRRFVEVAPDGLSAATRAKLGLPALSASTPPPLPPRWPLDRAFDLQEDRDLLAALVPRHVRHLRRVLLWLLPAGVLVALLAGAVCGAPRGVVPSLVVLAGAVWFGCVLLAEWVRWRAVFRRLARGGGGLRLVKGLVRSTTSLAAPLTNRPAVLARVEAVLGPHGLIQGVPFAIETPDGRRTPVAVGEAFLLGEHARRQRVRIATGEARRLLRFERTAEWWERRQWQFPTEDVIVECDTVQALGVLDASGTLRAPPAVRSVLVWRDRPAQARWLG